MKQLTFFASFLLFATKLLAQETLYFNPIYIPFADTTHVFTPKEYARSTSKHYPVVYLLHEQGGTFKQWNSIISVQKYADAYGFIIVCPDGFDDSWYINSPRKATMKFEDFFFKDLYPAIKEKYRVESDQVFITGIGMGGFGAMNLFLKKPDLFRSVGSCSGILDLQNEVDNTRLRTLLGNTDFETLRNLSIIYNIDKIAAAQREIIFDCGTDGPQYENNNFFKKRCDELRVKATYISQPGKHDRSYWQKSIRWHFDFFKRLAKE
ncbi:alpha/beta hydrolase [Flectobacillus major]|uniref:alpha/beta hydrolase n=1 Tax=Flectobacillus major TaxID=103 RepID=UPI0003FF83C5|nr:alpha/beta hydrolase family protein [Flectobacillus major]